MKQIASQILDSQDFKRIVSRRWTCSVILTSALFVIYYGYIVLIAVNKPLMARKVGDVTTLAIPMGVAVIVVSWVLTAIYVAWANRVHDPDVNDLKRRFR